MDSHFDRRRRRGGLAIQPVIDRAGVIGAEADRHRLLKTRQAESVCTRGIVAIDMGAAGGVIGIDDGSGVT